MDAKARIRELMAERKWSEYRLAIASGLSQSTVANIFNRNTTPSIATLDVYKRQVPHGVGVEMLSIKEARPGLTEIHANIYCERASHKSIIIGKQGAMLGKIGSEARRDIEKLLNTHVLLKLWVKVREDWRNRAGDLRALGYEDE